MIILTSMGQSQENNECLWKPSFKLQMSNPRMDQSYNLSAPSNPSETEALSISLVSS